MNGVLFPGPSPLLVAFIVFIYIEIIMTAVSVANVNLDDAFFCCLALFVTFSILMILILN